MAFPQSHLRGWLHMELRNHRRGKQPRGLLLRAESSHTGLQRVSGKSSKCQSRVFAVKRMGVPEGHDYAGNVWTPPPTALSLTPVPNVLLLLPLLHRP